MNKTGSYFENVSMPDERFRIKSFVSSNFEHSIDVHPHWHNEIEILYVLSGGAMQQVNDRFFDIGTGDVVLIGRNQLHSTYARPGEACEILVTMFDKSALFDCAASGAGYPAMFENAMIFHNPLNASSAPGDRIAVRLIEIQSELEGRRAGYPFAVQSGLYEIAALLLRQEAYRMTSAKSSDRQFSRNVLEKTFRLIDDSFDQEISVHAAAATSCLSDSHFCRLFKRTTGMTFNNYLTYYRVSKAEILLKTGKSVTETAMDCGFGSISALVRSFKKFKNCTPSACRRGIV